MPVERPVCRSEAHVDRRFPSFVPGSTPHSRNSTQAIAVMYLGSVVELAASDELYANTLHPYSKALLSAVPIPDPEKEAQKKRQIIEGDVPSPINKPRGCAFSSRCPQACEVCRQSVPRLKEAAPGHFVACHLVK